VQLSPGILHKRAEQESKKVKGITSPGKKEIAQLVSSSTVSAEGIGGGPCTSLDEAESL
jgi:hypothetical protein